MQPGLIQWLGSHEGLRRLLGQAGGTEFRQDGRRDRTAYAYLPGLSGHGSSWNSVNPESTYCSPKCSPAWRRCLQPLWMTERLQVVPVAWRAGTMWISVLGCSAAPLVSGMRTTQRNSAVRTRPGSTSREWEAGLVDSVCRQTMASSR